MLAFREHFWSLFPKDFLDCGKIPWLRTMSLIVENVADRQKFRWLWKIFLTGKISLTVENFLDLGKLTFMNAEKIIGLMLLKNNANIECRTVHLNFLWCHGVAVITSTISFNKT